MASFPSNLISSLKNGFSAKKAFIRVNTNSHTLSILRVLYREGYILSYKKSLNRNYAFVYLRYHFNVSVWKSAFIFSKSSNQVFLRYSDLCRIESRRRSVFVSTNRGVLSLSDCKKYRLGGTLLFSI
jgi:ribosomal protein S8